MARHDSPAIRVSPRGKRRRPLHTGERARQLSRMNPATRIAVVFWSAVPGLMVGILAGGGLWVVLILVRLWVAPAAPFLHRVAPVVTVACLVVLPLTGALVGAAEGWVKQR